MSDAPTGGFSVGAEPAGWSVPVAQALTQPVLLAGIPREYAILNGTAAAVIGLGLKLWWLGLIWWALAHALGIAATRADARFLAVLRRHLATPAHLDA